MCFAYKNQPVQKAEKDIIVYKCLRESEKSKKITSPIMTKYWNKGTMRFERRFKKEPYPNWSLSYGFHTCITAEGARLLHYGTGVYKCKIPKGALYIRNKSQYLSNRLILMSTRPLIKY